jgi:hypothetical protein
MGNNRTPLEMLGEFTREAAVLVGVFLPLDAYVNHSLTINKFTFTVVLVASLLAIGIWLEVVRR